MEVIGYCAAKLMETKSLLKEQREKNEVYSKRISEIIEEVEPMIKEQLERIVLEILNESGNCRPDNLVVGIVQSENLSRISLPPNREPDIGKILGYVFYHGYLDEYKIDNEFIDNWVDKRFKEKLVELGIPEEHVSGIEIDAEYPK